MMHFCKHATMRIGRRSFLLGTAGAAAAGIATSLGRAGASEGSFDFLHSPKHLRPPLPEPKPIHGGTELPGLPLFLGGRFCLSILPFRFIPVGKIHSMALFQLWQSSGKAEKFLCVFCRLDVPRGLRILVSGW